MSLFVTLLAVSMLIGIFHIEKFCYKYTVISRYLFTSFDKMKHDLKVI